MWSASFASVCGSDAVEAIFVIVHFGDSNAAACNKCENRAAVTVYERGPPTLIAGFAREW